MKTKKLISTVSLILIAFAMMNCTKANAKTNGINIFSKTIKESVLESRSIKENKTSPKINSPSSTKTNISQKKPFAGERLIKNKINPRICFSVSGSVSNKQFDPSEKNIHVKRLAIICFGRFVIPAANVLLLLF